MKKTLNLLIMAFVLVALAACNGENAALNETPEATVVSLDGTVEVDTTDPAVCTAQSQELPDIAKDTDFITGETEDYSVTIVSYTDFSCEGCMAMATTLAKTVELYPDDVRLIYRPYVDSNNIRSVLSAKAAIAAGMQGKFWEMYSRLFATQENWLDITEDEFKTVLWEYATDLELDPDQFDADINGQEVSDILIENLQEALAYGAAAPIVLVNNTSVPIYISTVGDFLVWMDTLMVPFGRHVRDNQFNNCPPMKIDEDATYTATIKTELGDVVIALYPQYAPFAVNSFVYLAENDYYDNTPFYAVVEGFIAQAGDPTGTGWGSPGYYYSIETSDDITFDKAGMVAMANAGSDAVNSQFFFTFSPLTYLNGKHTIFGEVIDGMDVLRSLTLRDPEKAPLSPLSENILDIVIEKQ